MIQHINEAQEEYLELLLFYKESVQTDSLSIAQICSLIDDVKCFWLEKLEIIEFELEELTENETCFLLSGAIYLNVSEFEHYYFKTFGDYHLLPDPFIRMENFFRIPEEQINYEFTTNYFRRAYFDTLEILITHKGNFIFLPIDELTFDDSQKHLELLNTFVWMFISSIFDSTFEDREDFYNRYNSFEDIESNLSDFVRQHLIFNDFDDRNLSLRERLNLYQSEQTNISPIIANGSDTQRFFISIFSYISQIADVLITCSALRIIPYIRSEVTFNYLSLIMHTFIEDKYLKDMLEKTLISYIFYRTTGDELFKNIDFKKYCKQIKGKAILDSIINHVHTKNIDIFNDSIEPIVSMLREQAGRIFE